MATATVQGAVPKHHALHAKVNGVNKDPIWFPTQVIKDVTLKPDFSFNTVESLDAFARGEAIVVMDDERRENEGDIIISASQCSVEAMAWTIKHTSGYICISLPEERLNELEIPMMVPNNQERHKTAYTIIVDYGHGTTTGISAHDRSLTVRKLVDSTSIASDFSRLGHMVPLRAQQGGIIVRRGHTETGVDLCALTNQTLGGVLCELLNDDVFGTMARRDDCRAFADRWSLKIISVEMLVQYRIRKSRDSTCDA
ncbi:3,4-dihydroxy-2-butanone 4-phosphate synthase-domain-containing protein [Suillus occidentalis]|nr:3,4-dihydroxy-2-butanone 4-phosphate synthase-domain-containing protein [Suillus occidentalis]